MPSKTQQTNNPKNTIMKYLILTLSASGLFLTSCSNYDTQAKNDAATGALIGAGAGAVLGDSGNRAGNAALGAALGGAAGYAVGANR